MKISIHYIDGIVKDYEGDCDITPDGITIRYHDADNTDILSLKDEVERYKQRIEKCQNKGKDKDNGIDELRAEITSLESTIKLAADQISLRNRMNRSQILEIWDLEAKLREKQNENQVRLAELKVDSKVLKEVVRVVRRSDELHTYQAMNQLADILVDYIDVED